MDFTQREIAIVVRMVGIIMVCIGAWMQHRRQYQLMPSLIAPMPLMIFGLATALVAFIVVLLPNS